LRPQVAAALTSTNPDSVRASFVVEKANNELEARAANIAVSECMIGREMAAEALIERAKASLSAGSLEKATAAQIANELEKTRDWSPSMPRFLVAEAFFHYHAGEWVPALRALDTYFATPYDRTGDLWALRAILEGRVGNRDEALSALEEARATGTGDPDYYPFASLLSEAERVIRK